MRGMVIISVLLATTTTTACVRHPTARRTRDKVSVQPDSAFLRLCAEPPKPAPGGGVGCLLRYQVF